MTVQRGPAPGHQRGAGEGLHAQQGPGERARVVRPPTGADQRECRCRAARRSTASAASTAHAGCRGAHGPPAHDAYGMASRAARHARETFAGREPYESRMPPRRPAFRRCRTRPPALPPAAPPPVEWETCKRTSGLTTTPQLGRYSIDPAGSRITFSSRHLFGLRPVRGTFAIRGGTVDVAEPLPRRASTRRSKRRASARATASGTAAYGRPRFLDADRHPVMTFSSGRAWTARSSRARSRCAGSTRPVSLLDRGSPACHRGRSPPAPRPASTGSSSA